MTKLGEITHKSINDDPKIWLTLIDCFVRRLVIESQQEACNEHVVPQYESVGYVVPHPVLISSFQQILDLAFTSIFPGLFEGLLDLHEVKPVV